MTVGNFIKTFLKNTARVTLANESTIYFEGLVKDIPEMNKYDEVLRVEGIGCENDLIIITDF